MASASQTVGEFTITGSNSTAGGPVTFTISTSIGTISGLSANAIQNATYAPDPNDPAYTIITFGGRTARTSNTKASVLRAGASSAVSSITQQLTAQPAIPPTNIATVNPAPTTGIPAAPGGSKNALIGTADGDSGAPQVGSPGAAPVSPAGPAGAGGTTPSTAGNGAITPPPNAPSPVTLPTIPNYTFDASEASTQEVAAASLPGKRLKNPLGEFNSSTYQLSLYAITPDAYEAFVASGRTKIDIFNSVASGREGGGAWLIAQSGGINNKNSKRAPGFEYDYGIDNLQIKAYISGRSNGGTANVANYDYTFDIIEPYGFSFISNLRRVGDAIASYVGGSNATPTPENPSRQVFVLGIRFFGYGPSGVPVQPSDMMSSNGAPTDPNYDTGPIDPASQTGSIFEHYVDININKVTFKVDGKMIVYNLEAKNIGNQGGFSMKRGLVNNATTITAGNVAEAIDKLMVQLNTVQQQRRGSGRIGAANTYRVVWAPGTQQIVDATLVSPADVQKFKWPGSGASTQEQVNVSRETQTQAASNTAITISVREQTPILSVINTIIAQSSFLENSLKAVYTTSLQAPENQNAPAQVTNTQQTKVSWYSCSASVDKMVWDETVDDWAYDITYYIQSYQTPVVDSVYVSSVQNYPGPHKRYDYWYTGKSTEILKYEQTLDNLYFNVALAPSQGDVPAADSSNPGNVPNAPGLSTEQNRQGRAGDGMEAQNNYLTSLYDPRGQVQAIIDIIGDPDYLFQEPSYSENVRYDPTNGTNGLSINPTTGKVFIEIDFKEPVDYTSDTGTLSINDSILFWKYPASISSKIKGIRYELIQVDSRFNKGAFTQRLNAYIPNFSDPPGSIPADGSRPPASPPSTDLGTPAGAPQQSASNPGTRTDPRLNTDQGRSPSLDTSNQAPATPMTPTGPRGAPVADDDG